MSSIGFNPHIRAIDLRKDLLSVANLIELCFSETMDDEGRDYIRHIRQISKGLGGLFIEKTTPENSPLPFHGYVWVENERIIGNLTLIQVRRLDRSTYFIANVAVAPEKRGMGIAQELTHRAIAHVKEHGGKKIMLQVRDDNLSARHIYESLGFSEDYRRTTWVWNKSLEVVSHHPEVRVTPRKQEDWVQQRGWLRELYPSGITWNLPLHLEHIKPGLWNWLNLFLMGVNTRSWAARKQDHLIGTATWEKGFDSIDQVWLATSPAWEEEAISSLLPAVIRSVPNPGKISINFPASRGEQAFLAGGMRKLNTLIWMSRSITGVEVSQ